MESQDISSRRPPCSRRAVILMGSEPLRPGYDAKAETEARALASGTRLQILKLCQERALIAGLSLAIAAMVLAAV